MAPLNIAGRTFAPGSPCIVAEMSANHAGRENLAHALIDAAHEADADAVKFQLYEPADMTLDSDLPHFRLLDGPWAGRRLWDLYTECRTPREWFPGLFAHAREAGLIPFASVFSLGGVAYLEGLEAPAYKIASAEVACLELVRAAAATGKPVVLSDGMARAAQLGRALLVVGSDVVLLRCVSEYPAGAESYGLGGADEDGLAPWCLPWGVSDHTTDGIVPTIAAALGATMIEAHLMLAAGAYGQRVYAAGYPEEFAIQRRPPDAGHSYEPLDFAGMVSCVRLAATIAHTPAPAPDTSQGFRRRLVWASNLPAGHVIAPGDVLCVRCGEGAEPDADVVGGTLTRAVRYGEPVIASDTRKVQWQESSSRSPSRPITSATWP